MSKCPPLMRCWSGENRRTRASSAYCAAWPLSIKPVWQSLIPRSGRWAQWSLGGSLGGSLVTRFLLRIRQTRTSAGDEKNIAPPLMFLEWGRKCWVTARRGFVGFQEDWKRNRERERAD